MTTTIQPLTPADIALLKLLGEQSGPVQAGAVGGDAGRLAKLVRHGYADKWREERTRQPFRYKINAVGRAFLKLQETTDEARELIGQIDRALNESGNKMLDTLRH